MHSSSRRYIVVVSSIAIVLTCAWLPWSRIHDDALRQKQRYHSSQCAAREGAEWCPLKVKVAIPHSSNSLGTSTATDDSCWQELLHEEEKRRSKFELAVAATRLDEPKPIAFAIPRSKLAQATVVKSVVYSNHTLGSTTSQDAARSYEFTSEREYRHAYAEALFGFTKKKRGWDCMRHLEILASGTLPIALGALGHACPSAGMLLYPSRILRQVVDLPGLLYNDSAVMEHGSRRASFDANTFDWARYQCLLQAAYQYTVRYMTTEALAKYILTTTRHLGLLHPAARGVRRHAAAGGWGGGGILFLSSPRPDYLNEMALHGFATLLGERHVHSWPSRPWLYDDFSFSASKACYGMGFSYTGDLKAQHGLNMYHTGSGRQYSMWWSPRDEEAAIRRRIRMRHYDLIVFGAVHRRHTWERFIDDVQRHYRAEDIIALDGGDSDAIIAPELLDGKAYYFKRELTVAGGVYDPGNMYEAKARVWAAMASRWHRQ